MVGFKVISLPSDERGRVGLDELSKVLGPDTAVCMMTNPNTLGLVRRSHRGDRRGRSRRRRADVLRRRERQRADGQRAAGRHGLRPHASQHAQDVLDSARGRRRRSRARSASRRIWWSSADADRRRVPPDGDGDAREAPSDRAAFRLDFDRPESIGPMRSFWSNFAHMPSARWRTYTPTGPRASRSVSQLAVLNANYMRVEIAEFLETPYR